MPRQSLRKKQRGGGMSVVGGDGNSFNGANIQKGGGKKNRRTLRKQQKKSRKTKRKSRKGGNPAFLTPGVLLALQKYIQLNPLKF